MRVDFIPAGALKRFAFANPRIEWTDETGPSFISSHPSSCGAGGALFPPSLARSLPLVTQANHHKSSFVPLVPMSPAGNAHFCLPIETSNDD